MFMLTYSFQIQFVLLGYKTYVWGVITQGDGSAAEPDFVKTFKVSTSTSTDMTKEVFIKRQDGSEVRKAAIVTFIIKKIILHQSSHVADYLIIDYMLHINIW